MSRRSVALSEAVRVLESMAPLALAEEWDNVGLLVEPPAFVAPYGDRQVRSILFTIDLTDAVLDEAIEAEAGLVVSYHPPIFKALKRLTASDEKSRVVVRAIAAGIAVHSPHTALDSAPGGVNDWLADGLPRGLRRAIHEPRMLASPALLGSIDAPGIAGQGRFVVLDAPCRLLSLVAPLKRHLRTKNLRVAAHPKHAGTAPRAEIGTVALCAGSGFEVILGTGADLLVTGEMSHHKLLEALATGSSVMLSEHSHTERGFLPGFARRIGARLGVETRVATADADPLATV